MSDTDIHPGIWVASSFGLATAVLLLAFGLLRRAGDEDPANSLPEQIAPETVTVWVGEVAPGLKGALAPVYGDPAADRAHDERLNHLLGGEAGATAFGFYRLLLFNTSAEEQRFVLRDDRLRIVPDPDGDASGLRGLSGRFPPGDPRLERLFPLRSLGTLRDEIPVPAGTMANLVVAFAAGASLESAGRVETAEGQAFRRLPMTRADLRGLMANPSARRVQDL